MKTIMKLTSACTLLLALAACGGGGGSSHNGPIVTPPPVTKPGPKPEPGPSPLTGPASGSAADLNAWVKDGTTRTNLSSTPDKSNVSEVYHTQRTVMIDGKPVTVALFENATGGTQMIRYSDQAGGTAYQVAASDNLVASPSDALYVGRADGVYRMSSADAVQHAHGDVSIKLDTGTNEVSYGVGLFSTEGDDTSVEMFGNATLAADGTFAKNNAEVIFRRDGLVANPAGGREVVNLNGGYYEDAVSSIVAGTITGANGATGFELDAGFIAGKHVGN